MLGFNVLLILANTYLPNYYFGLISHCYLLSVTPFDYRDLLNYNDLLPLVIFIILFVSKNSSVSIYIVRY